MRRLWAPGDTFALNGLRWRVVAGRKSPDDLRLDVFTGRRWESVQMVLGAMLADFFFENEEVLYPPPEYLGGQKYLNYVSGAAHVGWRAADLYLQDEKRAKREKDEAA